MAGKEPMTFEIGLDMKAFIFGVRASDALGKQAYNKVLTLADKDIEKLKEVQRFINVLIELHEEREVN